MRTLTKVGCAIVVGIAVVVGPAGSTPAPGPVARAVPVRGAVALVAFDSCAAALRSFQQAAAPFVGPFGLVTAPSVMPASGAARGLSSGAVVPDAASSPQQPAQGQPQVDPVYSTTNTHEPGVDEPDVVKTDGRRLITIVDGRLRVVDLASQRVTGTLELPGGQATQLLTHGNRALVVVHRPVALPGMAQDLVYPPGNAAGTRLVLVDLADTPRVLDTLTVDGGYLDARQIDGVARIVIRSQPHLGFVHPDRDRSSETALRENQRVVSESSIADWLPRYELEHDGTQQRGQLVDCNQVSHPARYSGSSMLTVLTVDLSGALGTGTPMSITADGDTVYGTGSHLYVAAARTIPPVEPRKSGPLPPLPPGQLLPEQTDVYQLDISGAAPPRYVAAGVVTGRLLNQYALSEYQGNLRVATTVDQRSTTCCANPLPSTANPLPSTANSQSAVTVLAQQGDALVEVGRVEGLGRGERIYAVRFVGPVGYVVTFRQTDPLYTVDLSDPRRPRLAGELTMTGYSAYLHPAGNGLLLGVGQEATDQGRRLGTQVSLFDVGDPAHPRRIAQYQVGEGSSQVEFDPHAFLYWPNTGLVVVPMNAQMRALPPNPSSGRAFPQPATSALVLRLQDHTLGKVGMVSHPVSQPYGGTTVRRALVVGDTLWTVSNTGVMANDMQSLVQQAWVSFP